MTFDQVKLDAVAASTMSRGEQFLRASVGSCNDRWEAVGNHVVNVTYRGEGWPDGLTGSYTILVDAGYDWEFDAAGDHYYYWHGQEFSCEFDEGPWNAVKNGNELEIRSVQ